MKKRNTVLLLVINFVFQFILSLGVLFIAIKCKFDGISSGNKSVDLYIYCFGLIGAFVTVLFFFRLLIKQSDISSLPYMLLGWVSFFIVSGVSFLLCIFGVPLPQGDFMLLIMFIVTVVLGFAFFVIINMTGKKAEKEHFDRLKKEIEERKKENLVE